MSTESRRITRQSPSGSSWVMVDDMNQHPRSASSRSSSRGSRDPYADIRDFYNKRDFSRMPEQFNSLTSEEYREIFGQDQDLWVTDYLPAPPAPAPPAPAPPARLDPRAYARPDYLSGAPIVPPPRRDIPGLPPGPPSPEIQKDLDYIFGPWRPRNLVGLRPPDPPARPELLPRPIPQYAGLRPEPAGFYAPATEQRIRQLPSIHRRIR